MKQTLEGCNLAYELIELGGFRKGGCKQEIWLKKRNDISITNKVRQTSALAVGKLER